MTKWFLLFAWPITLSAVTVESHALKAAMESASLVANIEIINLFTEAEPKVTTWADAKILRVIRSGIARSESDRIRIEIPGGETGTGFLHYSGQVYPQVGHRYRAILSLVEASHGEVYRVVGFERGLESTGRTFTRNRVEGCPGSDPAYIHWDRKFMPIPYFISVGSFASQPKLLAGITSSFETWRDVDGAGIDFLPMGCSSQSLNENDGINSIILVTNDWPFVPEAIAVTRNFFVGCNSSYAGQILDSDILLNAVHHAFSVEPQDGHHDIQNILTHEVGHLLGLGHETDDGDKSATMYKDAEFKETKKRSLKASDVAGIREAYPFTIEKGASGFSCRVEDTRPYACASVGTRPASISDLLFPLWLLAIFWVGRVARRRLI